MPQEIVTLRFSGVNCYLLKNGSTCLLLDSGLAKDRLDIDKELENWGCRPGNLKLIILTHGDPDHAGNAAYLRQKWGAKIAMHRGDAGMVEQGQVLYNRRANLFIKIMAQLLSPLPAFGLKKADRFKADLFLEDGDKLDQYGFEAKVINVPGHSSGSLGILTSRGDLFSGDLIFMGQRKAGFSSVYVNQPLARASLEKLKRFDIKTVYPGHGRPFLWTDFLANFR